jgi:hypothetical protein
MTIGPISPATVSLGLVCPTYAMHDQANAEVDTAVSPVGTEENAVCGRSPRDILQAKYVKY